MSEFLIIDVLGVDMGDGRGSRSEFAWKWVWIALLASLLSGSVVAVLLWGSSRADHRDALDLGWKAAAAVIAILAAILTVERLRLGQREHFRQLAADREKGITELSSKASEQLGSEKAAVRIGGLTDLERLGQSYPQLRQVVVDRVCAYLRGPYEPPPYDRPPLGNSKHNGTAPNEVDVDVVAQRRLELDVRRTAQQILQRHFDPVKGNEYWGELYIDLRDAALYEFTLEGCKLGDIDLRRAVFHVSAIFDESHFAGEARFDRAQFGDSSSFRGAEFSKHCSFELSTFGRYAWFQEAKFRGGLDFQNVKSSGPIFKEAEFYGLTDFYATEMRGNSSFSAASFVGRASFAAVRFEGNTIFNNVKFSKDVDFHRTEFKKKASFSGIEFFDLASFRGTKFAAGAKFEDVQFHGPVNFENSEVEGDLLFSSCFVAIGAKSDSICNSSLLATDKYNLPKPWTAELKGAKNESNYQFLVVERDAIDPVDSGT